MNDDRLTALRGLLARERLDAALLTDPADVRYFSGFRGEDCLLLVSTDRGLLSGDSRYWVQAAAEAPGFELVKAGTGDSVLTDALRAWQGQDGGDGPPLALGFQGERLSYSGHRRLRAAFGGRLRNLGDRVAALRQVKDAGEIAALRAASAVADAALRAVVERGLVGRAEVEVAWDIAGAVHDQGAEDVAFPTIVAAGPNGALPHAIPGGRVIAAGDLVVIDMGARLDGYHSDITRTLAVGHVGDEQCAVYDVVLRAQLAGLHAAGGGVACADVDAAARRVIDEAGYGECFGHGTGHGVGLEIHEGPRVARGVRRPLAAGMTVTIEPGIYLEGRFGVRIEDTVVVTDTGCEPLTAFPKELLVVE